MRTFFACLLCTVVVSSAAAETLDVVTTSSSGAMLVRTIAGAHGNVTVLGPPDRDLHFFKPRRASCAP